MKNVLEKFLMMYPDEVLATFASLPGAVVDKDYIYVPGTREDRVLLVAHADTVANKPPDWIEWQGNLLTGHWKYVAKPVSKPTPKADSTPSSGLSKHELTVMASIAAGQPTELTKGISTCLTPLNSDLPPTHAFADGKPETNGKSMVNRFLEEEEWEYPNSSTSAGDRWSYYEKCLGADDRAGIAILWLMRRSGHSLLITDHEETGGRGARRAAYDLVEDLADHRFAMQIDRRYDQEMVFYDCSTPEFEAYMQEQTGGYRIGNGSFTDIAILCPAAGICGVNLSAGYWNEHSSEEMLSYDAWLRTYKVVQRMLWRASHPQFILPPKPVTKEKYGGFYTKEVGNGGKQAGEEWWERTTNRYVASQYEPEGPKVSVRDSEIIAYQVGQMVFCRESCEDYVQIAEYDSPDAQLLKLRQQDISEWDSCETCGRKLWEEDERFASPVRVEENEEDDTPYMDDSEANAPRSPMTHLTGVHSKALVKA
jgi:hypothetical protein